MAGAVFEFKIIFVDTAKMQYWSYNARNELAWGKSARAKVRLTQWGRGVVPDAGIV